MSLLGHIASNLGNNMVTHVHNRDNQRFAEKMRQDERTWQEGLEAARAARQVALAEMGQKFTLDRDEAQHERALDLANAKAQATTQAATQKAQTEALNTQADRVVRQLERAQDTSKEWVKLLSVSQDEFNQMSDRERAQITNELDTQRRILESIASDTPPEVIQAAGIGSVVSVLNRQIAEAEALYRERERERQQAEQEAAAAAEAEKAGRGGRSPSLLGAMGEDLAERSTQRNEETRRLVLERIKSGSIARGL